MANVLLPVHAQDITDKALMSFKNHCILARYVDRQYDKMWGQAGAKRGTTINLRYPPQYALRRGDKAEPQGSNETYFPVTLGSPIGVDLDFTSQELLLTVDDFMNRFIKKAALPIANGVDTDIALLYKQVANFVGTPGTVPTDIETYLSATTALANAGAPVEGDEWSMIINYKSSQKITRSLFGQYNPNGTISKIFEAARMFDAIGYKWSQDQNIGTHTVGALSAGAAPQVSGGGQSGSSINIKNLANSVIAGYWNVGDSIQFDSVFGVKANSIDLDGNSVSTGELMNFVITQTFNAPGGGTTTGTIQISPPIITSGPFQNVTTSPIDGAAISTFGHPNAYAGKVSGQNLAFNKGAFVLGAVDLPLPGGMDMAARTTDEDTKFSIRFLRGFDINENVFISRLDFLHVAACPRPQFAVRVVA